MIAPGTSALVSVIVPAWQQERHAEAALRSVYDQDHEAVEVIVVDDASYPRAGSSIRGYLERDEVRRGFGARSFSRKRQLAPPAGDQSGPSANPRATTSIFSRQTTPLPGTRFSRLLSACVEGGAEFAFSRVEPRADARRPRLRPGEADYVYSVQDDIEFFPTVGYALLRSQCAVSTGNLFFSRRLAEEVGRIGDHERSTAGTSRCDVSCVTEPIFVPEPLCLHRLGHARAFAQRQSREARETESVLKNYLFLCRNRPVANPLAPSPAWGPFFDSFIEASHTVST